MMANMGRFCQVCEICKGFASRTNLPYTLFVLRIYIRQHAPKCLRRLAQRIDSEEIQPLSLDDLMDYRHCKCGWWIYGTSDSGEKIVPRALKVHSFAEADKKRRELNRPKAEAAAGIPLEELLTLFIEDRNAKGRTDGTTGIYQRIGRRVIDFCASLRPPVTLAQDVTQDHILKLRTDWLKEEIKLGTANYHIGIAAMIFRHGVKRGKLAKNPAQGIDPIERPKQRGAEADEEEGNEDGRTLPLDLLPGSQENYRKLLGGAGKFLKGELVVLGRKFARAKNVPVFTDTERFVLLMELMYETGLRVSDAVHFRPDKIVPEDEECFSYTTRQIKTGDDVTVFIPPVLAERLGRLRPLYRRYIFYDNSTPWRRFISSVVYRLIVDLGDAVGVPGARPHRFRDSFAVNQLNEGKTIGDVSTLLGHRRVETTRKYYSPWVPSRHEALKRVWKSGRTPAAPVISIGQKQRA
jgi:integrase